jgi:colanic acid biosynthesis glycosyl transferase WcaI
MSRILIWSPNYAPELIGIPPLVTDAAEWLAERGHEVDVVTAVPNYPERRILAEYRGAIWRSEARKGVRVHRSWLWVRPAERFLDKALYESTFAALSFPRVLARLRRTDTVVCLVPSLVAAAIAATVVRGPRLVLWVQDLVADAAQAVVGAPRGALGVARRLERYAAARANRVIVCSSGFREYFISRGIESERVETILNWVDTDAIRAFPEEVKANGAPVVFLYAGNLGYTQGFETLAEAVARVGRGIQVEVVGAGNAADEVRALGLPVRSPVPRHELPALLASAHVQVVIQRGVVAGANLPSKIATCLASGRPVVASLSVETPAGRLLDESGGALVVPADRPDLLAHAMTRLRDDAGLRRRLGAAGRAFAVAHLDKETALPRLEQAFVG